ncbi:RHOMBOID-like protein 2 [Lolium rigidum]|uniref:RHOMBOID-like protein 2 n=1 Tax=Lolium rigidum TaxID=89674 RepID=UPI001F5E33B3|nr:RHOMBOID-like protein 2 [Lolium rigidum]
MDANGAEKGRAPPAPAGAGAYGGYEGAGDRKWWPWLVPTVIVACIAVFVVEMWVNDCPKHGSALGPGQPCVAGFLRRFSFQPLRENPLLGPSSATLAKMGALDWNKVVHQNQGWRLISCIWLHAGLIHLLVNMLSLLFIGIRLEQQFGFVRIGAIYLVSGFGGSVLSALFLRNNNISVGASGALFGLLGSMLSELLMNWTIYSNKVAAIVTLLFIIVINVAIGILPHADNFAHIGGFIAGFLLGFVLLARPQFGWMERSELPHTNQPPKYKAYQYVLWVVALVLLLVGFILSLVMLFKGKNGNDDCHWCHYLNCVPTSKWKCDT